jgi:hypothetical protein
MPMTPWPEVIGKRCHACGGYATHIYGDIYLCCDCHGGFIISQEEARRVHETGVLDPEPSEASEALQQEADATGLWADPFPRPEEA